MDDETEGVRRVLQQVINSDQRARAELEAEYGQCWNTEELTRDFDVEGFSAPYVVARRKSDGALGSLEFRHSPRLYFRFEPHRR